MNEEDITRYRRYAIRCLERYGIVAHDPQKYHYSSADVVAHDYPDEKTKYLAWYLESILHALNNIEKDWRQVFFAYSQACEYRGRLGGFDREGMGDTMIALRNILADRVRSL